MIGKWLDQPSGCTVYPLHSINNSSCQLWHTNMRTHTHIEAQVRYTVNTPELKSYNIIHMTTHANRVKRTAYCLQGEMMLLLTVEPFLRKVMRENYPVKSDYYRTLDAFAFAYCAKSLRPCKNQNRKWKHDRMALIYTNKFDLLKRIRRLITYHRLFRFT